MPGDADAAVQYDDRRKRSLAAIVADAELRRQTGIRPRQIAAEIRRHVSRKVRKLDQGTGRGRPGPSNEASPIASRDIRKVSLIGPRRKSLNNYFQSMGITGPANLERQKFHSSQPNAMRAGNDGFGA